jgi:hypothetical protein
MRTNPINQHCLSTWTLTYAALSMYRDKLKFGHVPVHGQGRIFGHVPIHGKRRIWPFPCTGTRPNSDMSMYKDKPKFVPVPIHGQG